MSSSDDDDSRSGYGSDRPSSPPPAPAADRRSKSGSDDDDEAEGDNRKKVSRRSESPERQEDGEREERRKDREEDEEGDGEEEKERKKKKKKKDKKVKKKSKQILSDEEGGSGGEDDDDDEDSGDETRRPSKNKIGLYSDDDEDEDDDDEEMTEADKQFIVDDEEDGDEGEGGRGDGDDDEERSHSRKKKKRKKRVEDEEDDLDEEDLALLDENLGFSREKKFKKLRKKTDEPSDRRAEDLSHIFSDEEDDREGAGAGDDRRDRDRSGSAGKAGRRRYDDDDMMDEDDFGDDLGDFIIEDEDEDDMAEVSRAERIRRNKERKKIARNMGANLGIDDDTWRDIMDVFGDGTDYEWALRGDVTLREEYDEDDDDYQYTAKQKKDVKLTDVYEPSEIAEKMLTEADDEIRMRDIPERYQVRGDFPDRTETDLRREALYLARQLQTESKDDRYASNGSAVSDDMPLTKAVYHVLNFMWKERMEIPFIYGHRKDYLQGLLDRTSLWRIYDLDLQYLNLESRLEKLRSLYTELCAEYADVRADSYLEAMVNRLLDPSSAASSDAPSSPSGTTTPASTPILPTSDSFILKSPTPTAFSLEQITDIYSYLQLHYASLLHKLEQSKRSIFKRAYRATPYEDAKRAGLEEFVKMYGIDVQGFVASLAQHVKQHFPEDVAEYPEEAALRFTSTGFPNAEAVMKAARFMLAQHIGNDPTLRTFLRRVYETDAAITVTPTKRGIAEIEPHHPYYPFKYLREKPVYEFKDAQILQILAAETAGLVEVSIRVEAEDRLMEDVMRYIANDYVNDFAARWNKERLEVARMAMEEVAFPAVVKWIKEKLGGEAAEWLREQCYIAMTRKIDQAPFRPRHFDQDFFQDDHPDLSVGPRVLALSWGEGNRTDPTLGALLSENGELIDTIKLNNLQEYRIEAKQPDLDALTAFLERHSPDIVVVGGWTVATKTRLLEDVKRVVMEGNDARKWPTIPPSSSSSSSSSSHRGKHNSNHGEETKEIIVAMVDDDVSRIYKDSKRALKEFGG
ncbi:Transcription elongation factor spt6, partial [Quaeritorhiza haematococci]